MTDAELVEKVAGSIFARHTGNPYWLSQCPESASPWRSTAASAIAALRSAGWGNLAEERERAAAKIEGLISVRDDHDYCSKDVIRTCAAAIRALETESK